MKQNKLKQIGNYLTEHFWIIVILMFLLVSLIYFLLNNFVKSISLYNDELYYIEIAKSIHNGEFFSLMRGFKSNFSKLLYPLIISPWFGISNLTVRSSMIALTNSIVMISSLFPIYLICNKLNINKLNIFLILILASISPFLINSMTFMSEILYYPLSLLLIYLWLINNEKESPILSACIGLFIYLMFLCKEVAIFFLFIFALFELIYPLLERMCDKDKLIISKYYYLNRFINLGILFVSFFVPFLIFKFTLFKDLSQFYHQISIDAINTPEKFFYVIYSFFYFIIGVGLIVFFIPLIYPAIYFKTLKKESKCIFVISLMLLIVSAFVNAYSVNVREDFLENYRFSPRILIRYSVPALILFISLFIEILQNKKKYDKTLSKTYCCNIFKRTSIVIGIFLILFVFMFKGTYVDSISNTIIPSYYLRLQSGVLKWSGGYNTTGYYLYFILFNLIIALIIFFTNYLLNKKINIYIEKGVIGGLAISCALTFAYLYNYNKQIYQMDKTILDGISLVENLVTSNKDKSFLFVISDLVGGDKGIDTYLSYTTNSIVSRNSDLINSVKFYSGKTIEINRIIFYDKNFKEDYKSRDKIDYVIKHTSIKDSEFVIQNLNLLNEYSSSVYSVYENINPKYLSIK